MKIISAFFILVSILFVNVFASPASLSNKHHEPRRHQLQHRNVAKTNIVKSSYAPDPFVQNWMGHLAPIINNVTLMDISVPASHDSGTWDLTQWIADNSNDLPADLAWLLHEFGDFIKDIKIGDFIRDMAKTQGLSFTQQLDSGLRFIDFRIDWTAPQGVPSTSYDKYDWYVMHLVESKQTAMSYLRGMQKWLLDHPTEILVLWVSHHGSPCDTDYRITNNTIKQDMWHKMEELFAGMIFDASARRLNETTIGELQQLNQRVIFYMGDYKNFTNSSRFAQDSCNIDNDCPSDSDPKENVAKFTNRYENANSRITADKKADRYYLMSGSGPTMKAHFKYALEIDYLAPFNLINVTQVKEECASLYKIPGSTWCPLYLQESGQNANFYHQTAMEYCISQQKKNYETNQRSPVFRFPNAIYIDAIDINGTIRTGSQIFFPNSTNPSSESLLSNNLDAKYAFADTLMLSNVFWVCSGNIISHTPSKQVCDSFIAKLEQRRAAYPWRQWTDLSSGRLAGYAPAP